MTSDYIVSQLRSQDYDRFLLSFLAPAARRPAVQAVLAFHVELLQVPEQAKEPLLTQMRFVWWREGIQQLAAGTPREHPVLQQLAELLQSEVVSEQSLGRLIDAHAVMLDSPPPATVEETISLLSPVAFALADLLGEAVGADFMDDAQREAARSLFTAAALTGAIRAVPHLAAAGRCQLPLALLQEHGITTEQLSSAPFPAALPHIIVTLAEQVENLLTSAQFMLPDLPRLFRGQWHLARMDARTLRRQKYQLTPAVLRPSRWRRILLLWRVS